MHSRSAQCFRCLVVWILLLGVAAGSHAQPAFRVADLNTVQSTSYIIHSGQESEAVNALFYLVMDDGIHGDELWVSDGSPGGTRLVADLCPGACGSNPHNLMASPGRDLLLFAADDGVHGVAFWESRGTPGSTRIVFNPFPYEDDLLGLGPFFEHAGSTFFSYFEPFEFGGQGRELVRWTGTYTPLSFFITDDINPFGNSYPRVLAGAGDQILVTATDAIHGWEPWVLEGPFFSDALSLGDLKSGSVSSLDLYAAEAVAAPWGGFVFVADDGTHGLEVWRTDGTPESTFLLKDISAGAAGSSPRGLAVLGGAVYFTATDPQNGEELWRTNGTPAGTVLVKDIQPGGGGSAPFELTLWGNRLFFYADDGTHGVELWATDGTTAGTVLVKDAAPGPSSSFGSGWLHSGLSLVGNRLLFFAADPAGTRLWRSDGTTAGTVPVDPPPQSPLFWPFSASLLLEDGFGVAGGYLYFRGSSLSEEIWRTDGTSAGTVLLADTRETTPALLVDGGALEARFGTLGGNLFFQATDGFSGFELWKSDGTAAGTVQVSDLNAGFSSSFPNRLRTVGGRLVFATLFGEVGLWSTDGTPGGTQALPVPPQGPTDIGVAGGNAFFFAPQEGLGIELWKTDGTPAGTGLLEDLFPGVESSIPHRFAAVGSRVFFAADDSAGTELWVSDGTAPGTFRVADIRPPLFPGGSSSDPTYLTAAGNLLFFIALTDEHGWELWKSDGTQGGTVMVKDILPGPAGSISLRHPGIFASTANGLLFFIADDGQHGEELWKSDGTAAGTVLVKDIRADFNDFGPRQLTAVGNRVYFTAFAYPHGQELWVSDGTEAGTHMVEDILPGLASSQPRNLAAVDGTTLVFSAFDGQGVEPWRSAGTAFGTRRLADIAPGALSSSPMGFTAVGPNVYFAANDNTTGFELWAIPREFARTTFEDVPPTYWAWLYVEALVANGLTTGCGGDLYCPARPVTRAEMAVFVLRAIHGAGYVPPDVSTVARFADIPASHWALDWIEQLATEGITSGCSGSPPLYCPESPDGPGPRWPSSSSVPVTERAYTPPPATGTVFTDVPASYWAAAWIEQLAAEGITTGCAANLYCPGDPVSRDQMAVFLTRVLDLPLP